MTAKVRRYTQEEMLEMVRKAAVIPRCQTCDHFYDGGCHEDRFRIVVADDYCSRHEIKEEAR
jgi:hypothetical protein